MNRQPLSPQQLADLRAKAAAPVAAQPVDEARQLAYVSGIKAIEPIMRRIISLERTVAEQGAKITALETQLLDARVEGRFR